MNNRDVSVSICGIVAGIMLAAATVSPVSASLVGSVTRPAIRPVEALRNLARDRAGTSNYKRLPVKTTVETVTTSPSCALMKEVHGEVSTAITLNLTYTAEQKDSANAKASAALKSTLDALLAKHCGTKTTTTKTSTTTIDNNCDDYVNPSRRSACLSAEDRGVVYP